MVAVTLLMPQTTHIERVAEYLRMLQIATLLMPQTTYIARVAEYLWMLQIARREKDQPVGTIAPTNVPV
jgi:hypothetical protein